MLGFSSFSELPLSTIPRTPVVKLSEIPVGILSELLETRKIPVEILSSVLLVVEKRKIPIEILSSILGNRSIPIEITTDLVSSILDIPIEIIGSKPTPEGLKWVLNSRGTTWEVSEKLMELIWKLSDSGNNTWKI